MGLVQLFTTEAASNPTTDIQDCVVAPNEIANILAYVLAEERVVQSARIVGNSITVGIKFVAPTYTVRPVEYLSSSALCISTAQTAHILIDHVVSSSDFAFPHLLSPDRLERARMEHHIYFTDLRMKFRRLHPSIDYSIQMSMVQLKEVRGNLFGWFAYRVDSFVSGSFIGCIPKM